MAVSFSKGATCTGRSSKAGKGNQRNSSIRWALQFKSWLSYAFLNFTMLQMFKIKGRVIFWNMGTDAWDFTEREFYLCRVSTYFFKDHQGVSWWLEPWPWHMVPNCTQIQACIKWTSYDWWIIYLVWRRLISKKSCWVLFRHHAWSYHLCVGSPQPLLHLLGLNLPL